MDRMKKRLLLWSIWTGTLALALLLLGCDSSSSRKSTGQAEIQQVRVRLKWLFNASFAGEIWGVESGLFSKRGFNVTLLEGGPEQDAIKDLELNRAEFGIASADQVFRAAAKGVKVKVLAQIFQKNPLRWIYSGKRLGVITPKDLAGRIVGITYGGNDEAIFSALLKKWNIPEDAVHTYAVHYDFTPFWKGKVDLWPVYYNTQGVTLAEKMVASGDEPAFFAPDQWEIRFVANSLVTSARLAEERPSFVRKFTAALTEAWKEAMDPKNEAAVAEALMRYEKGISKTVILKQLRATREIVAAQSGREWGAVDLNGWRRTLSIMKEEGLIEGEIPIEEIWAVTPP